MILKSILESFRDAAKSPKRGWNSLFSTNRLGILTLRDVTRQGLAQSRENICNRVLKAYCA